MNQDLLDLIDDELFQDNIDTKLEGDRIVWRDNFGAENEIYRSKITTDGERIAWWQENEVGKDLVRIRVAKDMIINWRPPINTMGLTSGGCFFIEFYRQYLIVAYPDKHHDRVFFIDIEQLEVKQLETKGRISGIKIVEGCLYVREPMSERITKTTFSESGITTIEIVEQFLKDHQIDL